MSVTATLITTAAASQTTWASLLFNYFITFLTIFNVYALYQRFFGSNVDPLQTARQERHEAEERLSNDTSETIQQLKKNTMNVINLFQDQKTHMAHIISDFERTLQARQEIDLSIVQANEQQMLLVEKDKELLLQIKTQYEEFCTYMHKLFHILKSTCDTMLAKEQEHSEGIEILKQFKNHTQQTIAQMSEAAQGLSAIEALNSKKQQYKDENSRLKQNITEATSTIEQLMQNIEYLLKDNEQLRGLLEQLKQLHPNEIVATPVRRSSSPKLFVDLKNADNGSMNNLNMENTI